MHVRICSADDRSRRGYSQSRFQLILNQQYAVSIRIADESAFRQTALSFGIVITPDETKRTCAPRNFFSRKSTSSVATIASPLRCLEDHYCNTKPCVSWCALTLCDF